MVQPQMKKVPARTKSGQVFAACRSRPAFATTLEGPLEFSTGESAVNLNGRTPESEELCGNVD